MSRKIAIIIPVFILMGAVIFYLRSTVEAPTAVLNEVDPIKTLIQSMTLEEKVSQMFLAGIYSEDSAYVLKQLIIDKKIGSVILMGPTIKNRDVAEVVDDLQDAARSTNQPPLLISIDQEGGTVSRIKDPGSELTSQPEIHDSIQAYKVALTRGSELKRKGVNVNFSPVLENITEPSSFLYSRVFRGTTENIASYGESMVRGYQDAGIAATIKHFPGHEDSSVDSHKNLPVSTVDKNGIYKHTRIFKEVIDKGNPLLVMTAHVLFPEIDKTYPATLSPELIGILRDDYQFDGVIITDDMNMGAITKMFGVETAAVQAVRAGNDILLYVADTTVINRARDAVISAISSQDISEGRIDESVYRILKLKGKLASE